MKFPLESQNEIAFDGFSAPVAVFSRRKPSRTCLADIEQYFRQGSISTYTQRCPSRGRPRRMLHLMPEARHQAEQLMPPWHSWLDSHRLVLN